MNKTSQLVGECKALEWKKERSEREAIQLGNELLLEKLLLNDLEKDCEIIKLKNNSAQKELEDNLSELELNAKIRNNFHVSSMMMIYLGKFIDTSEPTEAQQLEKSKELSEQLEKTLAKYEDTDIYRAILREEARSKELSQHLTEMRNALMKLETEKEF